MTTTGWKIRKSPLFYQQKVKGGRNLSQFCIFYVLLYYKKICLLYKILSFDRSIQMVFEKKYNIMTLWLEKNYLLLFTILNYLVLKQQSIVFSQPGISYYNSGIALNIAAFTIWTLYLKIQVFQIFWQYSY